MKWWWQRDLAEARQQADQAEKETEIAVKRRAEAEKFDKHAQQVEAGLRRELVANGFADALRAAFGGLT